MKPHCNLLFNGMEISTSGKVKPCCLFSRYIKDELGNDYNVNGSKVSDIFYSSDMQYLRRKSLAGEYISECDQCYMEEKAGAESRRQRENRRETIYETPVITQLDIKPGNTCNLKCRICNPEHSSLFNNENKKLGLHSVGKSFSWGLNNNEVWSDLKLNSDHLTHIDFMGGEPMLIDQHIDLLQYLVDQKKSDQVEINYVSNGTVLPEKVSDILKHFKHVNFVLSADGIGDVYEYCRYPGKWETFAENLKQINAIADSMIISYSVSVYSLFGILDALDFYEKHEIPTWFNFVHNYDSCITILPDHVKELFIGEYKKRKRDTWIFNSNIDVEKVINFMNSAPHDETRWNEFINITRKRDTYRNQSAESILKWLNNN